MRKFAENPLVPIGALLTTGFLFNGLFKFGRRDSAASQTMMRGRIAAQVSGNLIVTFRFKISFAGFHHHRNDGRGGDAD